MQDLSQAIGTYPKLYPGYEVEGCFGKNKISHDPGGSRSPWGYSKSKSSWLPLSVVLFIAKRLGSFPYCVLFWEVAYLSHLKHQH